LNQTPQQPPPARRRALIIAGIALAFVAGAIVALSALRPSEESPAVSSTPDSSTPESPSSDPDLATELQEAVTLDGVMRHLEALQDIADDNGGNRFTATGGHEASVDYVTEVLTDAGYEVTFDEFEVTVYEENEPARLEIVEPSSSALEPSTDFTPFSFSPSGDVTAPVAPVGFNEAGGPGGCEDEAFAGFPDGDVALVQAGPCTLTEQVFSAEDAGASAVLVMFPPDFIDTSSGVLRPTLAGAGDVPALAVSSRLGLRLAEDAAEVRIEVDGRVAERTTRNVLAEKPGGPEEVVMVGGHLDSVPDGPGINDNGSGSAAILELAVQMADVETSETVRFAFWTAEELGLIGSENYVGGLDEAERERITAYLNFDMVASPNYMTLVYDDNLGNVENPAAIKELFLDYFEERDLGTDLIDLSGRSDHGPFERFGVPVGGIFTGAEMIKDGEAQDLFGGEAGEPADSCYHLACDDIDNLNEESLDQLSDAIAFAVATLATSSDI